MIKEVSKAAQMEQVALLLPDKPKTILLDSGKTVKLSRSKNKTHLYISKHLAMQEPLSGEIENDVNVAEEFFVKFKNSKHQAKAIAYMLLNSRKMILLDKLKPSWLRLWNTIYNDWTQADIYRVLQAWFDKKDISFFFLNMRLTQAANVLTTQRELSTQEPPSGESGDS